MQKEVFSLFPPGALDEGRRQSEACLVLNVWTPALDSRKRPVMVWLHGGGFAVGSGSGAPFDGTRLCTRGDVVVVTLNHRLNTLGYLYLGEIGGERFAQSGNVGMLDIVAALHWVRDNIAGFGGDPGNVTIFGESGGAGKVSVVCAMPAAKGLFHKAIMQSGPSRKIADKQHATAIAKQLLQDLGLSDRQLGELQNIDAAKLVAAAETAEQKVVPRTVGVGPMGLVPVVDDVVIHHHPFDTEASPESADVPFMVGSTKDEALLFLGPLPDWGKFSPDAVFKMVQSTAGARAAQALELYTKLRPGDSPSYRLSDIVTDAWMRQAANQIAELKVKQGRAPAYVFVVEWEINPIVRSPHTTDVSLAFDTLESVPTQAAAPGAQAVADQMSSAWLAFAHSGNPNTPKIPHWPAYSLAKRPNMLFNVHSRVVEDYNKQAREFWEANS
jgi:para-nitrobenzyl esterase